MIEQTVAYVTPWFGLDAPGGAEAETRRMVKRLADAGLSVEVLTTCIRDFYADWGSNYYSEGVSNINDVLVRRFAVQPRDQQAFNQVNWRLMNNISITDEQEQLFISQMIRVPGLYEYIEENAANYLFIFIPYMFATTYYGSQIAPEKSLLVPCLHDESYARLAIYREILPRLKALIMHSPAEAALVESLYGPVEGQLRPILGGGIDTDWTADGQRFRQKYNLNESIVLYAGRREAGKNIDLLLDYWRRYHQQLPRITKLVLIGPGDIGQKPDPNDGIVDLGFLSVQDKYDAYDAADIFCNPSVHESFSRSLMESWLARTPAVVHSECAVTRDHCQLANGGLYFNGYQEFAAIIDYLLDHPKVASQMGQQGRTYVLNNFRWEVVLDGYLTLFEQVLTS